MSKSNFLNVAGLAIATVGVGLVAYKVFSSKEDKKEKKSKEDEITTPKPEIPSSNGGIVVVNQTPSSDGTKEKQKTTGKNIIRYFFCWTY
jgi:hypothetical protein